VWSDQKISSDPLFGMRSPTATTDVVGVAPRKRPQIENPATWLARLRLEAGLTQAELASAAGLAIATYIRLERGQLANPRIGWLVNCAIVLRREFDDLLEEEMLEWHPLERRNPPPPEWYQRKEVVERARRWTAFEELGD
jgi:transcriptional regulator with XRE-family HTH domain